MNAAAEQPKAANAFTLWSRRSRCDPWREVGQAATSLELTGLMSRMRSGEYITLPTGQHPDDSRKDLI